MLTFTTNNSGWILLVISSASLLGHCREYLNPGSAMTGQALFYNVAFLNQDRAAR